MDEAMAGRRRIWSDGREDRSGTTVIVDAEDKKRNILGFDAFRAKE